MKTSPSRRHPAGFVSYLLVISTGSILSLLMIYAYRRAVDSHGVQSQVQLRVDYSEKEEAILRSIVAITPNRAIRAMQAGSSSNTTVSNPLRWQDIFTESLVLANARTSISSSLATSLAVSNLRLSNAGDSALDTPSRIFKAIPTETGYVSAGINRSLGTGYPVPLTSTDNTTNTSDPVYPIISNLKTYGTLATSGVGLAVASYPNVNLLKYPQINFGYAKPGEDFVAKRNWWAFSVNVGNHDGDKTFLARSRRDFVLSIYEIPSQLAISAASFMSLGQYASGQAWQNVTIDGGMFVGKAEVQNDSEFSGTLASRRGMTIGTGSSIGGQTIANNPFAPGERESYQVTQGAFLPVSLASESGRSAFIPINRGPAFFDRFSATENDPIESSGARNHIASNVLSTTSWNNYSIGAQQCAMRLDVTKVEGGAPTELRLQYYLANGNRAQEIIPLKDRAIVTTIPSGYVKVCDENQSFTFSTTTPVDVAYGVSGGFTFRQGVTGTIDFNNNNFGDPKVGSFKAGYWRPMGFHQFVAPTVGQKSIYVYPHRLREFLELVGGAPVGPTTVAGPFGPGIVGPPYYNNSISVNVDYTVTGLNNAAYKPNIPPTNNDFAVVLKECSDMTRFTKGFSLVTNMRLYIGDDFNVVPTTPPAGYTPAVTPANPTGRYLPPCSLFAPEQRYGVDTDPFEVLLGGQIGSLAKIDKVNTSDSDAPLVRPLDSKYASGGVITSDRIRVNLSQMRHPAELPPISMMNWLVLLEERRKEYY